MTAEELRARGILQAPEMDLRALGLPAVIGGEGPPSDLSFGEAQRMLDAEDARRRTVVQPRAPEGIFGTQLPPEAGPDAPPLASEQPAPVAPPMQRPPAGAGGMPPRERSPYAPAWSRTIPGGDRRAAYTVQKGTPYDPDALTAIRESGERQMQLGEEADAEAEKAKHARLGAEKAAQERADVMRRDFEMRDKGRRDALAKRDEDIDSMSRELASTPIESPNMFAGKNFGESILSAIGTLMLGGGAAANGQLGRALDFIEARTQDNVKKQQAEMSEKRDEIGRQESLYGRAAARFGDQQAAEQAAHLASMQMIEQEMARFAELAQTPESQRRAELAREEWRERMALRMEEFRRTGADQIAEQWQNVPSRTVSGDGPPSLAQQIKQGKQKLELRDINAQLTGEGGDAGARDPLTVPGYGRARSPKMADEMNAVVVADKAIQRSLDTLEAFNANPWSGAGGRVGGYAIGSKEYKDAVAAYDALVPTVAVIVAGGGKPSDAEVAQAEKMAPDPTAWGTESARARIGALRDLSSRKVQSMAEQNVVGTAVSRRRRVQ